MYFFCRLVRRHQVFPVHHRRGTSKQTIILRTPRLGRRLVYSLAGRPMLIKREHLKGIKARHISLVFRRWRRATVRAGGKLRTAVGELAIDAVDIITDGEITDIDARHAGFSSRDELITELHKRQDGSLYRVRLHFAGSDPRVALRQKLKFLEDNLSQIDRTLRRLDSNSPRGSWTIQVLRNIADHPGTPAANLATFIGAEKKWLKLNIRKLKALGLTESLPVGYRLSPRGKVVLRKIEGERNRVLGQGVNCSAYRKGWDNEPCDQHRRRRS